MIPILMYHQVDDIPRKLDSLGLAVSPAQFEQQMSYLARNNYRCLSLPEAMRHFQKDGYAPARSFVLTFDDGYQDVHSKAYPILEKYGFTATVFLVAGRLGSLSNWWGQEGSRSGLLLTQVEAQELVRRGYIMGSHSLRHPFLTSLDDQSAYQEILGSKLLLQEQLEIQVDFFSYPYSETDPRIETLVESAGYKAACAGDKGLRSNFHLWRVPCNRDDSPLSFALKASGWYDRRTALRESTAGRHLRNIFRVFRRLSIRHPNPREVLRKDLERDSKGGS